MADPLDRDSLEKPAFTTLDRIRRTVLRFDVDGSRLLRRVVESEVYQEKRFERLALALIALYPGGSDERGMVGGARAAVRAVR